MECKNCDNYKVHNCKRQCMDLPDGKTCADCVHVERCTTMFGAKRDNTSCGWEPIRFKAVSQKGKMEQGISGVTGDEKTIKDNIDMQSTIHISDEGGARRQATWKNINV